MAPASKRRSTRHGEPQMMNSSAPTSGSQGDTITQSRIILMALASGVVMFTAVALFVGPMNGEESESTMAVLEWVVLAYGVGVLPLVFFLRRLLDGRIAPRKDAAIEEIKKGLMPVEFRVSTILPAALAESAGLFGCVVLLLTGNALLLIAPIVSVAVILYMWPSESGLLERAKAAGRR